MHQDSVSAFALCISTFDFTHVVSADCQDARRLKRVRRVRLSLDDGRHSWNIGMKDA